MNPLKPLKPIRPSSTLTGVAAKEFHPANVGITKPHIDNMGGRSMAPAAKEVRRVNRAGVVGRKISIKGL